ncbi:cytidine deaminase [Alkalicoccobacillus murimartini]|uniref:Cytidine deaminase n=1 Tax=Alkalicoccobacillus murimartini TaxID=171685 RepID=A0ABT9YER0_9BACI|nr:cytidine deaminase [Alkalicoccobacillus murimartini]MDQ0205544.1 cytidine deaminase [Alkalicoccobacillus murimartini]
MQKQLMDEATKAREQAYVPYSKFQVGAALLMKDGSIFHGANIENASFGLTNCAERTALYKAYSEGNREVQAISVIADTEQPVSPCGACRQVMMELCGPDVTVYLGSINGKMVKTTVGELLPGAFKAGDMNE